MAQYKVGDRIFCNGHDGYIGGGVVESIGPSGRDDMCFIRDDNGNRWFCTNREDVKNYITHASKKSIMSRVSSMMKKLLDRDTQTLVKAGYINGDLELTSEGQKALNAVIFETNKAALVKVAEELLEE